MYSDIGRRQNILISLDYNEAKITQGKAERIKAENFLKDHDRLTKDEVVERFRQRTIKEMYQDRGYHFSLNFGEREKIPNEKLVEIAGRYMAGMGFDDQPYLIYRHYDAGHTHLHVVASSVLPIGTVIRLYPHDYKYSHDLCRGLEKEYALERSADAKLRQKEEFSVDHEQRVAYGERGLKHALSDVLNTVVEHYNYTSLDELNAVLKQYNVEANPGLEGSRLNSRGGLIYHALDYEGHRIGVPLNPLFSFA